MKLLRSLAAAASFGLLSLTAQAALPATSLTTAAEALALLPEVRLPASEVQQRIVSLKHEPLRFAVPTALNLDERSGSWSRSAEGLARWQLRVDSAGARSLALRLSEVNLPPAAELWFYDTMGRDVQGPITAARINTATRELSLPLVRSDAAVLEVRVPVAQQNQVAFKINEAYHGYRSINAAADSGNSPKAAIGDDAGSCNIDVVCTEGNNWRNEIRSTVLLVTTNQSLCTGSLVNNTRQDDRALVLTANHCGIRSTNIGSVIAYFNTQSTSCGGNQNGRIDQNIDGGSFLARDENSDFTLFSLASLPPAAFNVLYAGWDARSGVAPQSGVTMHHPQGDEKKIAVYSTAGTAQEDICIGNGVGNSCDGFLVDSWRVTWSRGTTEAGSSGSGLWNQNRQLVGVLSGGGASCGTPNEPDFFGRIERAWQANAATNGQLKAHLDPIGSNCLQLNSKNPGTASPLGSCGSSGGGGGSTPENAAGSSSLLGLVVLLMGAGLRRRLRLARRASHTAGNVARGKRSIMPEKT